MKNIVFEKQLIFTRNKTTDRDERTKKRKRKRKKNENKIVIVIEAKDEKIEMQIHEIKMSYESDVSKTR